MDATKTKPNRGPKKGPAISPDDLAGWIAYQIREHWPVYMGPGVFRCGCGARPDTLGFPAHQAEAIAATLFPEAGVSEILGRAVGALQAVRDEADLEDESRPLEASALRWAATKFEDAVFTRG